MARRDEIPRLAEFRQSHLAGFLTCARRTRFAIQAGDDSTTGWVGTAGHLGTAMHAVMEEYLRTLYRQGEGQMATQEAVEVMYEVLAKLPFVLPFDDLDALRGMVLAFCNIEWQPTRIMALEQKLTADLLCPDGEVRTVKGQPDILMADPPHGLVIVDLKTGRGKPRAPRQAPDEGETIQGRAYLSERGHFQLDTYGLLALTAYPAAQYVTLRELHLRSGEVREATLSRGELEHVERKLSLTMMQLDRAISEGTKSPLWAPRPGSHCMKQCPVSRSCRIKTEQRGEGAIATQVQADAEAAVFVRAAGLHEEARLRLKAWQENANPPGRVNENEDVRWGPEAEAWQSKGGGRKFGVHPALPREG